MTHSTLSTVRAAGQDGGEANAVVGRFAADKHVTVIIDLTGIRAGTGPARLLDMVEGRSKQAFKTWLVVRPSAWRDAVDVVAIDGFTGTERHRPAQRQRPVRDG